MPKRIVVCLPPGQDFQRNMFLALQNVKKNLKKSRNSQVANATKRYYVATSPGGVPLYKLLALVVTVLLEEY